MVKFRNNIEILKQVRDDGRSMVEMLGVLAIIGVLSAGALAGFNRAMMQHKLNKNTDEISYLLATAIFNQDKLKDASFDMLQELQALGAFKYPVESYIPVWPGEGYPAVNDSLGNQIWFEHYTKEQYPEVGNLFAFAVYLPQNDYINKVCHNYVNIFKNLSSEIYGIHAAAGGGGGYDAYLGRSCTSSKCLATMTNMDIANMCQNHCANATRCVLYAMWGVPEKEIQQRFE